MKKLITLLTTTSFSLVPTVNIVACESKAEEEIVGETIAQEILEDAIDEMKKEQQGEVGSPMPIKANLEDEELQKIVTNYKEYPEFIPMMEILRLSLNSVKSHNFSESLNIYNLPLVLPKEFIDLHELLKQNLKRFKVIPVNKKWIEDVKTVNDSDNPAVYEFRLKFGKTLSKKTIEIKMFWNPKEGDD